jgi:hypothetical protein
MNLVLKPDSSHWTMNSFSEEEEMFDIEESEEDECLDDFNNETQNEMEDSK